MCVHLFPKKFEISRQDSAGLRIFFEVVCIFPLDLTETKTGLLYQNFTRISDMSDTYGKLLEPKIMKFCRSSPLCYARVTEIQDSVADQGLKESITQALIGRSQSLQCQFGNISGR